MEETLKAMVEEYKQWVQTQLQEQTDNIAAIQQRMEHHQQQNQLMLAQILAQLDQDKDRGEIRLNTVNQGGNPVHFNPKIEFPVFEGNDPRGWIKKCTRYFGLCKVNEDQRVDLASLSLKGPAETWFASYIMGRRGVTWEDFVVDVCNRFRDNIDSKVVEDFNKLQQSGSLDEYLAKFEELKTLLLINNPAMPDMYLLESFVGGLKPAIKAMVRAFRPPNLDKGPRPGKSDPIQLTRTE